MQQEWKEILSENPLSDILGQERVKQGLKSALLAGRNVVIIGPPGVGKTTLAKNVAKLLPKLRVNNCEYHCLPARPICPACRAGKTKGTREIEGTKRFVRVQGSPDLTAEDLIGDIDPIKALKLGPLSAEAFTPGKIFKANNGVLFFDELNRCPEKLQNALLQALEEKSVTVGSYDIDFPVDFIFIATMNPEDPTTERIADVLLDRFDVLSMEYPESVEIEQQIIREKGRTFGIFFPEALLQGTLSFIHGLRASDQLEKFPGVRASLGLYERAQTNALLGKRREVALADIQDVVVSVLVHRIQLKPSVAYVQDPQSYVQEQFGTFLEKHKKLFSEVGEKKEQGDGL